MRVTRAQIKALLVKSAGFRDDADWWLSQNDKTGELEFRVYHVTSVIHRDGSVSVYGNLGKENQIILGVDSPSAIQEALYDKAVVA